jgi:hypothetical protein
MSFASTAGQKNGRFNHQEIMSFWRSFVGWVEARMSIVGFRTSTQPTQFNGKQPIRLKPNINDAFF